MTGELETLSWDEFVSRLVWHQGEHVTLVGPTGCGKTTLGNRLLGLRSFVCVLATKPTGRDKTTQALIRNDGYRLWHTWADVPSLAMRRSLRGVLWPRFILPSDVAHQQLVMDHAIRSAFVEGGWCLFADELWYLCNKLKLAGLMETVYTQGRSIGLSLVAGTQRPAHVPLLCYDQATHLFFWRDNDETNLRRIAGLGGLNAALIRHTVARLPKHAALYVNTRTGQMFIIRPGK